MFFKEISIPENVSVEVEKNKIKVSGPKGNLEKVLKIPKDVKIEKIDNKIKVSSESDKRKMKAVVGANSSHIRNMIEGVVKGYAYKLRTVYSHFPVTVKVEKDKVLIQNFLGERKPRTAKIVIGSDVKIDGSEITVSGIDLEAVSQTAGNIELSTRIAGYDKKRFQDGIWIIKKAD